MTPERKAYLAKCSKREKYLRVFIKESKIEIRKLKSDLKGAHIYSRNVDLLLIRHNKIKLNAYRHELAKIKGMDRVAPIILETTRSEDTFEIIDADAFCGCCKQLLSIFQKKSYCPNCGRKILWEKVKK